MSGSSFVERKMHEFIKENEFLHGKLKDGSQFNRTMSWIPEHSQEPRKGGFWKGAFANIYASLDCGALSVEFTA